VLAELDRRQQDSEQFIHPQRDHADIVVAFRPNPSGDPAHLDANVILRDTLRKPPEAEGSGLAFEQRPSRASAM
jgi:phosphoribulokinase